MIGRYGMDQLGQFIMYAVLVLIFLNVVVRVRILSSFLYILELAGFFLLYFRMFSKNVGKRYQENQVYLRLRFYVTEYFRKIKFRFTEGRKYRIFKCPDCGQTVSYTHLDVYKRQEVIKVVLLYAANVKVELVAAHVP